MTTWRAILAAEVERRNDARGRGGIQAVATILEVSRTAVSLLLAGKYPARSEERMAARVLAKLGGGRVICPYLEAELGVPECRSWRARPMPRSNPDAARHWTACRTCPVGAALGAGESRRPANAEVAP